MEVLGAVAGTLQLIQALMKGLDEVNKVHHEIKHQDQTLKDFDADLEQMEMTLIAFEGVVRTASNSKSMEKECSYDQASPGANVDIHVDDANTGNSIENAKQTSGANRSSEISQRKANSVSHQVNNLTDHILHLKDSIDQLRHRASDTQQGQGDPDTTGLTGQSVKDTINDSNELANLASSILETATTVGASIKSRIGVKTGNRTRAPRHSRAKRTLNQASQSNVYNPILALEASMSLIGVPLSTGERENISNWRDNVVTNQGGDAGSSHPGSESSRNSKQIVAPPSSASGNQSRPETRDPSLFPSMFPQLPLAYHEPDLILDAAMHLISPHFEDICSSVADMFKCRIRDDRALPWMNKRRQQLLKAGNFKMPRTSQTGDVWLFLDAIFRTNLSQRFSDGVRSNPFISSPSLMEARFLMGRTGYQRGNLVTAAPLLIIFANNERIRIQSSGAFEGPSHVCRPETERGLLCGKLLCQLDPFS
ncbi:hypothetical protein MRS44_016628 [Fusarium solani]|uniref:uncharacterized protein n=1 Tax=Fusarium solani TaxID=169388 RepID=UPI0032C43901|nr:hypothetical protein MRS44_016628 [Fusarium solani]